MALKEYLIRAKLDFAQDRTQQKVCRPSKLPIDLGPFELKPSPNANLYLGETGWGPYIDGVHPDGAYPVALVYVEYKLHEEEGVNLQALSDEHFEALETLLRLFQPGEVSVRRHERMWRVDGQEFKSMIFFDSIPVRPEPAALYDRLPYRLDDSTLERFVEFFNGYWSVLEETPQSLRTALNRFNSSYERRTLSDRLIDLVIALEALFGDGESSSITYKVAMRCACWLKQPGSGRQKTFRDVRKSYAYRSKVVHGRTKMEPTFGSEVDALEAIVRGSLVKLLVYQRTKGKAPDGTEIDRIIMSGG